MLSLLTYFCACFYCLFIRIRGGSFINFRPRYPYMRDAFHYQSFRDGGSLGNHYHWLFDFSSFFFISRLEIGVVIALCIGMKKTDIFFTWARRIILRSSHFSSISFYGRFLFLICFINVERIVHSPLINPMSGISNHRIDM